ncbi:MAG: ATP-binding cassette domain-containing protein [Eubacteriales bacterium]
MQIVAEKLSHVYSPKSKFAVAALKDVSLTIDEGEFFGIIGHTGSGKSTFVQHLNGLIKADKGSGKLRVGEFDLLDKKCDFKKLRAKIGMVFQYPEYQLFADTVEADVALG